MEQLKSMTKNVSKVTGYNMATGDDDNTALGVIYLVISVLVMLSNSVVITVIVMTRELHLPTLWNLAFMAAWDFIYGLGFLLFSVPSAFLNRFAYSENIIGWVALFGTILTGQNILNIVLVMLDRYISICWPMKYAQIITMKRFILAAIVSVALNIVRTCFIIFPDMDFYYNRVIAICVSDYNTVLGSLVSITTPMAAFGTIFFCLIKIIHDISRSRQKVHPYSSRPTSHVLRFSLTIVLAAGVFCLSYIPTVIVILCNLTLGKENVPKDLVRFAMVAIESNSLWNIIIYATTYRPFRDALLRLACKDFYRRQRRMEFQTVFSIKNRNIR